MFAKSVWSCAALLLVISSCLTLSMAKMVQQKRSTCVSDQHTNGCSTPTGHEPYIKEFTPACDEHDVCYFCGKRYGISRDQCDEEFKKRMHDLCDSAKRSLWGAMNYFFSGDKCKATANVYYVAVHLFGAGHYVDPSPSWCEEECVKKIYSNITIH